MKELFVIDLKNKVSLNNKVILLGWVRAKRMHGKVIFLDVCDSTGCIQAVVERARVTAHDFGLARKVTPESSVKVEGILGERIQRSKQVREISAEHIEIIGPAEIQLFPQPRGEIDIFDPRIQEQLLNYRHFYLRNEKMMAILRFRHIIMGIIHQWFRSNGFIEITAPILTPTPLYDDRSAISLEIQGQKIFLTQCVGFYLESAVHAFERVYNIGPSFRGEESKSKRHLMEYWHLKAEVAFGNFEDIVSIVENLISYVTRRCCEEETESLKILGSALCADGGNIPYSRISYAEVVPLLQKNGFKFEFGKSLGSEEETFLSEHFQKPFWVIGIPRSVEPFPYVIDSIDPRVTKTADLIATEGYGEILGVAEKIHDPKMLDERMEEKGKLGSPQYEWLRDLRHCGCVPHVGFGMGIERFIRWLLRIPHVRDTIPFFRTFGRRVGP